MKVVSAQEMARIENLAYQDKGPSLADHFMENAGQGIFINALEMLANKPKNEVKVYLLCAKGNNSGDAYVCGRKLLESGFRVTALQLTPIAQSSELCRAKHAAFVENGGTVLNKEDFPQKLAAKDGLIIDGLLGTGFRGLLEPQFADLIDFANNSTLPILAVDTPSGLDSSQGVTGPAITAKRTAYLGLPKHGFFMIKALDHTGQLAHVDFGLDQRYLEQAQSSANLITLDEARNLLPKIKRTRHKYEAGVVTCLAGSLGMEGAASLCALAALRAGSGLVRLLLPDTVNSFNAANEIIRITYNSEPAEQSTSFARALSKAKAALVGPGLSFNRDAAQTLWTFMADVGLPTVIDADALSFFAEEAFPVPKDSVMTPHMGEMMKLLGQPDKKTLDENFLEQCEQWAKEREVTLLLKGAPTIIFTPTKGRFISTFGDPGMATAGSGDVLAGIIAAQLAQGLSGEDAAILGATLHGLSGEIAAKTLTSYCLCASDLITYLPKAYQQLMGVT